MSPMRIGGDFMIKGRWFKAIKLTIVCMTMVISLAGCKDLLIGGLFKKDSITKGDPLYLNGINIMDLGTGGTVLPGVYNTNYTSPSLASLQFLKARGNQVIRIPFLWERVQTSLNGPLNTAYLGYIMDVLRNANSVGLKVILDMHNYGRYETAGVVGTFGYSSGPSIAQYADVWTKLVNAINSDSDASKAIYAFDIMNEPYSLANTQGSIDPALASPVSTFTVDNESWESLYSDTHVTLSRNARNGGSLKVDYTTGAASYIINGVANYIIPSFSSAAGPTIRVKGNIPANIQGDNPIIRVSTWKGSQYTTSVAQMFNVNKGQDFEINFTPTTAQWVNVTGLLVELILNNVDGTGPYTYYIDDISQGATLVGRTPSQVWEDFSQGAVTAIRATGDTHTIMIEGDQFSSARSWSTNHPTKWITDPLNKIVYQAHLYMDSDSSGTYSNSFPYETSHAVTDGFSTVSARSISYAQVFTDWLTAQNAKGYIGEIGWPNSAVNVDYAAWDAAGEELLTFLDSHQVGYTLWATGSWLGPTSNNLNTYDLSTSTPLSQAAVLERHYVQP